MKNKVLIICGPTATGKTALGLRFARDFNGEVLSADSRHVYKGMDIITGKDLPSDGTKIYLTDLVSANEDFSVSQWRKSAVSLIQKLWNEGKLPIIVGGTGLYIKSLMEDMETIDIPQNKSLRQKLSQKTAKELYELLADINPVKAANMNNSDRNNPRRLVRAIEIASHKSSQKTINPLSSASFLLIGLSAPQHILFEKISERVLERLKKGAFAEVENLVKSGLSWETQSMSAVGYKEFKDFFEKKRPLDEVIDRWKLAEQQYAKRQITWFKKQKDITWLDVTDYEFLDEVENLVRNWYNGG